MALLAIGNLNMAFGGLNALTNFNLELNSGELVGLIGPNGAGKTTVFNILTGVYAPTAGTIIFNDENITGLKPYIITQRGIARTFQNIRLFSNLSVLDNVRIAYHPNVKYGVASAVTRIPSFHIEEDALTQKAIDFLKIFSLEDKMYEIAKNLPYGQQRRLEIARALATQPKLLLLDEPAAGMNPQETHDLMNLIKWIRSQFNLTILLIEHDMSLVMGACERMYVLDYGIVIAHGNPTEIKANPRVIEAYLGEEVPNAKNQ